MASSGVESAGDDDPRGVPCWMGLNVPIPLSDNPGAPCTDTVAFWPELTSACWPDTKSVTSTWPLNTPTRVSLPLMVTWNRVPFTTAERCGVSTSK